MRVEPPKSDGTYHLTDKKREQMKLVIKRKVIALQAIKEHCDPIKKKFEPDNPPWHDIAKIYGVNFSDVMRHAQAVRRELNVKPTTHETASDNS